MTGPDERPALGTGPKAVIVLGLGARSGVDLGGPVRTVLAEVGLTPGDVSVLATLDRRAAEPRFRELAAGHGWRIVAFPAGELAAVPVRDPREEVLKAVGTPSVAEAAARLAAGPGAELILPKRAVEGVTVALYSARVSTTLFAEKSSDRAACLLTIRPCDQAEESPFW